MSLLLPQPVGVSAPRPSLRSEAYWEGCRRHRVALPTVRRVRLPRPRRLHRLRPVPRDVTGLGGQRRSGIPLQLDSGVAPAQPGFRVPYAPAVVHLDEGVWMLSAVIGCEPDELHDGLRLSVEFHPASDEITLPYFAPDAAGQP